MRTKTAFDLQSLVDTHDGPFVIIDRDFNIVAVNRAYEQSYGMTRDQMLGKHCYQISHHNEQPCFELGEECPYQQVYDSGMACTCMHIHYDTGGCAHRVKIKAYPLQDADGEMYIGEAIHDLSQFDERSGDKLRMAGESDLFMRMLEQLNLAAASNAPVLLQGETGTGKDLAANFIHLHSSRRDKPFLTLDCTVLTESLFEAEVFGHERGAFTGSVGDKEGLFELVDGGTLFLDEIGELPAQLQAKLLRVLETGEYRRVGGRKTLHTNARIICATNRNLGSDVESKTFREDLYYRVACLHVRVPALRERLQDVPLIANVLLERISASVGQKYLLSPEAVFQLQSYQYPGNIRELRNILSVAAAHCTGITIEARDIVSVISCMKSRRWTDCESEKSMETVSDVSAPEEPDTACTLEDLESRHIAELLKQYQGNRRQAAAALGVSERTMYRKLKRYGLG